MKKIIKSRIFLVIITAILCTGITVYATSTYQASQVEYKDGKKVDAALNELYTKATTYKNLSVSTTAKAEDIISGKTAYDNLGNLITGNISADCVSSSFATDSESVSSSGKKLANFKPSFFIVFSKDSPWVGGGHIYNVNYSATQIINFGVHNNTAGTDNLNNVYTITDNGFWIYNWGAGNYLYYMACK